MEDAQFLVDFLGPDFFPGACMSMEWCFDSSPCTVPGGDAPLASDKVRDVKGERVNAAQVRGHEEVVVMFVFRGIANG